MAGNKRKFESVVCLAIPKQSATIRYRLTDACDKKWWRPRKEYASRTPIGQYQLQAKGFDI